jgi:alpha-glucosidase (family GH31 glycosyl hydrolase)
MQAPTSDQRTIIPTFILTLQGRLSTGTLWWEARHGNVSHYQVHNEYGLRHAEVVASILKEKDTLVLSAATHTGIGAVGGSHAHAQANVRCLWGNMKTALLTALGLGLAGIPLVGGGSVCGTTGDYDEELCLRLVEYPQTHVFL